MVYRKILSKSYSCKNVRQTNFEIIFDAFKIYYILLLAAEILVFTITKNDFNRVPRIPLVVRNRRANEINFFFKDLKTQENYMYPNYLSWSYRGRSCTPFIPRAHAYDYSLMFTISTVTAADRRGRARGEIKSKIKCGQPVLRRERPPVRSTHYGVFGLPPENPA